MTLYTNSILEVYYLQFKVRILAAGYGFLYFIFLLFVCNKHSHIAVIPVNTQILANHPVCFKCLSVSAGIWQDRLPHKFEQILVVKMRIYKV